MPPRDVYNFFIQISYSKLCYKFQGKCMSRDLSKLKTLSKDYRCKLEELKLQV